MNYEKSRLSSMDNLERQRAETLARQERLRAETLARQERIRAQAEAHQERLRAQAEAYQERLRAQTQAHQERLRAQARAHEERVRAQRDRMSAYAGRMAAEDNVVADILGAFFTNARPTAAPRVSPSEETRRRVMAGLDPKERRHIEHFGSELTRSFIEEVGASRQANPEVTDWQIHLDLRRAVEVDLPDPLSLEKVKLSDALLSKIDAEGQTIPSRQRSYPF